MSDAAPDRPLDAKTGAHRETTAELRRRAWELRIRGATIRQIAKSLGKSSTRIHELLGKEREAVLRQATRHAERYLADQVGQLEQAASEAFEAWERSKRDAETITETRESEGAAAAGKTRSVIKVEGRAGDPRFLAEWRAAMADLREVLGFAEMFKAKFTAEGDGQAAPDDAGEDEGEAGPRPAPGDPD